jgi:hypothetical protein
MDNGEYSKELPRPKMTLISSPFNCIYSPDILQITDDFVITDEISIQSLQKG